MTPGGDVVADQTRPAVLKVGMPGHYRARVKATGKVFESGFVTLFTLRDGKVTLFSGVRRQRRHQRRLPVTA